MRKKRKPRELNIPPTPETIEKLRPDPLDALLRAEKISPEQWKAGEQIRNAIYIITSGSGIRVSQFERREPGRNEHETDWQVRLQHQYSDWVDIMTRRKLKIGVVLDFLIDELSIKEIAVRHSMRKDSVRDILYSGLTEYVTMMGWKVRVNKRA